MLRASTQGILGLPCLYCHVEIDVPIASIDMRKDDVGLLPARCEPQPLRAINKLSGGVVEGPRGINDM